MIKVLFSNKMTFDRQRINWLEAIHDRNTILMLSSMKLAKSRKFVCMNNLFMTFLEDDVILQKWINASIPSVFQTKTKANFSLTVSSSEVISSLRTIKRQKLKFSLVLNMADMTKHFFMAWKNIFLQSLEINSILYVYTIW